jgi:hypothetical protein
MPMRKWPVDPTASVRLLRRASRGDVGIGISVELPHVVAKEAAEAVSKLFPAMPIPPPPPPPARANAY